LITPKQLTCHHEKHNKSSEHKKEILKKTLKKLYSRCSKCLPNWLLVYKRYWII